MPALHLSNRTDSLVALVASAVASVAVLGGAVLLFADAGHTPAFDAGSKLAEAASMCTQAPSVRARHQCLREVGSAPAHAVMVAESSNEQPLP
jgi:hypothetical protein